MARICAVSKKKVLFGNKVSHSNRKTRTRFNTNQQHCSFPSDLLGCSVRLHITPHGIRTLEKRGGLDAYLISAKKAELDENLLRLKKRVVTAKAKKEAKAA